MAQYRVPVLENFSWQPPVIDIQNDPPGSPTKGDRYAVAGSPTGAWVGHAWNIATYTGSTWLFDAAMEGMAFWNSTDNTMHYFNGSAWTSFPVSTHAASHQSGGGDAIKLDDLAAPDDNTDLNVGVSAHGLCPKAPNDTAKYLRGDGSWATIPAGSVPTGTGFRHVTAGSEDAAAKLVENADVAAAAAIAESKLALNYATHPNANDPTADQKAALAGTTGTPSVTNKYVTNSDPRNTDSRTPTSHATSHKSAGGDPIKIDELAVPDDVTTLNASVTAHGLLPKLSGSATEFMRGDGSWATPPGLGDMLKSTYDTDDDGKVDNAEQLNDGTNIVTAAQSKEAYDRRASYDSGYKCLVFTI